jgi:replication initiation protein RepC
VQILETAGEYGLQGEDWAGLARDTASLARALRRIERPVEMLLGVESLERRQRAAREHLEALLVAAKTGPSEAVDSVPLGPENRPHQNTYNPSPNPQTDTVMAPEKCSAAAGTTVSDQATPALPAGPEVAQPAAPVRIEGTVLRLSTDELVRLAPRLRSYLTTPVPTWPGVVDAADWLRGELGVSKSLWGEACLAMGREEAAIAVAIVSTKPAGHFRSSPGGYFHGMVAKAKAGELNLARTIWGLRARDRRIGEGRSPGLPANLLAGDPSRRAS